MNKKNLILGIVLALLVLAAWGYEGPFKSWKEEKAKAINLFSGLDLDKVNQIEVAQGDKKTAFTKVNDKWKIDGTKDFWLTQAQADQIKTALDDAKKTDWELVSQNKAKKADYQTDGSGRNIRLIDSGKDLVDFSIGKMGPDYKSTYLSLKDSDKTFLVKASLVQAFGEEDWRDKAIFTTDKEKVTKLRIHEAGVDYVIEKKTSDKGVVTWNIAKPKAITVKTEKVDEVLAVLSSLTAVEIPNQTFNGTGLDKNSIVVEASGDGIDNTLMLGSAKKSNGQDLVFAKKGTSDNIYLISKDQASKLNRKFLGI